jgi:hypothetical protein
MYGFKLFYAPNIVANSPLWMYACASTCTAKALNTLTVDEVAYCIYIPCNDIRKGN